MSSRLRWGALGVLLLVVVGLYWGMGRARVAGKTVHPERGNLEEVLWVPGWIEPEAGVVNVSSPSRGVVTSLSVAVGDRVEAGQILATLEQEEAAARVAQARAGLLQAEANARTLRALFHELEQAAASAQEAQRAEDPPKADPPKADPPKADPSNADSPQAGAAMKPASAMPAADGALERRLMAVLQDLTGEEGGALLSRSRSREEAQAGAEAAVALARARVQEAAAYQGKTVVRSPSPGIVVRLEVSVGEVVGGIMPSPLLSIADTSRVQVRLEIDEADVFKVKEGLRGFVTTQASGATRYPGEVRQVAYEMGRRKVPLDDPRARVDTRVLEAVMSVEGEAPFRLQQRVEAGLVLSSLEQVLLIPVLAVNHRQGKTLVRVQGGLGVEEWPVRLGISDGARVQVLEGLKGDETLVLDPAL